MQNIVDEVYYLIYSIRDPEFPQTLEELKVVDHDSITVIGDNIEIRWKPTVEHCSFAFQIALAIRTKLAMELLHYKMYKIKILTHEHKQSEEINKQVNDKERVQAAMENDHLMEFIMKLIQ